MNIKHWPIAGLIACVFALCLPPSSSAMDEARQPQANIGRPTNASHGIGPPAANAGVRWPRSVSVANDVTELDSSSLFDAAFLLMALVMGAWVLARQLLRVGRSQEPISTRANYSSEPTPRHIEIHKMQPQWAEDLKVRALTLFQEIQGAIAHCDVALLERRLTPTLLSATRQQMLDPRWTPSTSFEEVKAELTSAVDGPDRCRMACVRYRGTVVSSGGAREPFDQSWHFVQAFLENEWRLAGTTAA